MFFEEWFKLEIDRMMAFWLLLRMEISQQVLLKFEDPFSTQTSF